MRSWVRSPGPASETCMIKATWQGVATPITPIVSFRFVWLAAGKPSRHCPAMISECPSLPSLHQTLTIFTYGPWFKLMEQVFRIMRSEGSYLSPICGSRGTLLFFIFMANLYVIYKFIYGIFILSMFVYISYYIYYLYNLYNDVLSYINLFILYTSNVITIYILNTNVLSYIYYI